MEHHVLIDTRALCSVQIRETRLSSQAYHFFMVKILKILAFCLLKICSTLLLVIFMLFCPHVIHFLKVYIDSSRGFYLGILGGYLSGIYCGREQAKRNDVCILCSYMETEE
jgi:hypothetical protein